jgi:predicted small metal-binding protein
MDLMILYIYGEAGEKSNDGSHSTRAGNSFPGMRIGDSPGIISIGIEPVRVNLIRDGRGCMERKDIECRDYPGDGKCTVAISDDKEKELLEAVMEHATKVHGYPDAPEFREKIRGDMKEGNPRL